MNEIIKLLIIREINFSTALSQRESFAFLIIKEEVKNDCECWEIFFFFIKNKNVLQDCCLYEPKSLSINQSEHRNIIENGNDVISHFENGNFSLFFCWTFFLFIIYDNVLSFYFSSQITRRKFIRTN